jgi:hypothetical protein
MLLQLVSINQSESEFLDCRVFVHGERVAPHVHIHFAIRGGQ